MRKRLLCWCVWIICLGWPATADEVDPQRKAAEVKLNALQYPGSTLQNEHHAGTVTQHEWVTSDSLAKVEAWYRQQYAINAAFIGGVADVPWPAGVKVTEAKGQQQWAIVRDDLRLKNDGTRQHDIRPGTTRTFFLRTPEQTLFTVLNRGPQDKQTLIAILVVQEPKRKP